MTATPTSTPTSTAISTPPDRRTATVPGAPRTVQQLRSQVFTALRGRILEIGPGDGVNLPWIDWQATWIGIEPSRRRRARLAPIVGHRPRCEVVPGRAEHLPLPDRSVDAVVGTFVLCSVDDPVAALREIRRVSRPGAPYVFAEHIAAARGSAARRRQDAVTAFSRLFRIACRTNRTTDTLVAAAGFDSLRLHRLDAGGGWGTRRRQIVGIVR